VKVCCTYCSIETDASSEPVAAIQRWGTVRVKNAERFANNHTVPLLLLTADQGLVDKNDRVLPGGNDLSEKEISSKARLVARQLEENRISDLKFLVSPSNRLALAYLRLITLACDRARVTLEVLDHRGMPFAEWSKVFRQAEETKRRASKPGTSVKEVFADLFRRYGEDDGIVWFKCGEAYRDRQQYADALGNFRQAAQLFPMKEWRDAANSQAKLAEKHIPRGRSLTASTLDELEEIDRLARDADVKRLSSEGIRVAGESPWASILLSYAAIERIDKRLNRLPPDLRAKVDRLRPIRNEIAHGSLLEVRGHADSFKGVLLDMLKFAHGQLRNR
jgi:tetratricopeptide (TPR) repeat protein